MKILALDLGDVHNGVAISDAIGITCMPLTTLPTYTLIDGLKKIVAEHRIKTIVAGYPKTMRGTESSQTKKIVAQVEELKEIFPLVEWKLWDERLTSKMAAAISRGSGKKQPKQSDHARAAALILQSYLDHLQFTRDMESTL